MEHDFVRKSRAGDAFHYRWAARRCLKLVAANSSLEEIYIEGSKHSNLSGEYSMDTSEYHKDGRIEYFQLKHSSKTSKRAEKKFPFSEMKGTLQQFSQRYLKHKTNPTLANLPLPRFFFITNREISEEVKKGIPEIGSGSQSTSFSKKLANAISLKPNYLKEFCQQLELIDSEGDFNQQKYNLSCEAQQLLAGDIEDNEVDGLIALISDRALPSEQHNEEKGRIIAEDVLRRLGVTTPRSLFPAPSMLEALPHTIEREKFDSIKDSISNHPYPTIVEATGGSGKSVLSTQLAKNAQKTGFAVIYDCFANGHYRNPSQSRHRASDALVQIVNELAMEGLCKKLIPRGSDSEKHIFASFVERLEQACNFLKNRSAVSQLFIIIDAADNAEMAAEEFEDKCFASALLRETLPENCKLVMLCRPERRNLLLPANKIQILELPGFSEAETLEHLRIYFPDASKDDALELHQLTNGNPRVQAMALNTPDQSLEEILYNFGPSGMSVEDQIETQLDLALDNLKDQYPQTTAKQIENICLGLASLPPYIPKAILAEASGVSPETITSFISELGRPIRDAGDSVQFKDEPTESWFRKRFIADISLRKSYCSVIKRLATQSPYAARALPSLLLQAKLYSDLVSLALSEDALPTDNSIEARDIRVYRLQYAFKAAIRLNNKVDAAKLALRAGEEVAGNSRQQNILKKNIGVITQTQSPHRLQQLAFSSEFKAGWPGSENIYSSSLLSSNSEFRGDARSYLRGAENWLKLLMEEQKKRKDFDDESTRSPGISPHEMAEMGIAYLNLYGIKKATRFLTGFYPDSLTFAVSSIFFERLIDSARFTEIAQISRQGSKSTALILASCHELAKVAKFPPKKSLQKALSDLDRGEFDLTHLNRQAYSQETTPPSLLSLCEAAAHQGLSSEQIIRILEKNVPSHADSWITYEIGDRRKFFFQSVALKSALHGDFQPSIEDLISVPKGNKTTHTETTTDEITKTVETLLPWFALRAHLIAGIKPPKEINLERFPQASRDYWGNGYGHYFQMLPYDISKIYSEIITLSGQSAPELFNRFHSLILRHKGKYFRLSDAINFLRVAFRCEHLEPIREQLEQECANYQKAVSTSIDENDPESDAQDLVDIAKAILPISHADASAYFDQAIEQISRFGDEIVERWTTTQHIANRASSSQKPTFSLCERFFKCAEAVSESVTREKHWDRCETFAVGTKLNYISAFSTWSQWRDRRLHSYRPTLLTIAKTALEKGFLPASAAWSLTGFEECNANGKFHALCIRKETNKEISKLMATQALKDLELADAPFEEFQALAKETAIDYSYRDKKKDKSLPPEEKSDWETKSEQETQACTEKLEQALGDAFPKDSAELKGIIGRLEINLPSNHREILFETLIKFTPLGKESPVLDMILHSDQLNFYSLRPIISLIRERWLQKAAIKKQWPHFIRDLAKRYTNEFSQAFHWGWYYSGLEFSDIEKNWIREGISEALSVAPHSHDASTFFTFVSNTITNISHDDALDLLDYSLSRFEVHIPDDFGENLVISTTDSLSPLSGLIWSALGSPSSAERWQAAHCVTRLGALNCQDEIDQLIMRLKSEEVGIYGSQKQIFFLLHAKLYLLIALDRVATESPSIVRPHSVFLADISLDNPAHILIQKTAANICLKISGSYPDEYDSDKKSQLQKVGVSQFALRHRKSSAGFTNSPWHNDGKLKNDKKPSFENDFGWYWFPQLNHIFGVHQDQIEDLARNFALEEIGLTFNGDYGHPSDGREYRSYDSYSRRAISSHSHGSYPYTDNYSFYYSYHSFLHAGAQLLGKVPVTCDPDYDYDSDRWESWLSRHSLTRKDGFWLSDRRDSNPQLRRKWTSEPTSKTWRYEIQSDDFFDSLVNQCADNDSMFVSGSWSDINQEHVEDIQIRSALVTPQTAEALARYLRSQRSPYDFAIPRYDDEDDYSSPPFEMLGWITSGDEQDLRLDRFDPYSREISYPPIKIRDNYAKLLNITADQERRFWYTPESDSPSVFTEIWSEQGDEMHKLYRSGHRMQVKKDLLIKLCLETGLDLLFCVKIGRSIHRLHYNHRSDEENISLTPSFKIFILSHDGILRDSKQHHPIR